MNITVESNLKYKKSIFTNEVSIPDYYIKYDTTSNSYNFSFEKNEVSILYTSYYDFYLHKEWVDPIDVSSYNSSLSKKENKEKLDSIRKLEYNWNDNYAEPIDKIVYDNILKIIEEVIIQPKIFPTANESIQLEYYDDKNKNKYLEFEVFKDYINVYEVLSNSQEKLYKINSININEINSIIMCFYEFNKK